MIPKGSLLGPPPLSRAWSFAMIGVFCSSCIAIHELESFVFSVDPSQDAGRRRMLKIEIRFSTRQCAELGCYEALGEGLEGSTAGA